MQLLTPGGSWFDWLVQNSDTSAPGRHSGTDQPVQADLDEAIEAMRAGHIEYVILDAGDDTFVQAGGQGDTGYQLEHWSDSSAVSVSNTATVAEVRAAMTAYLQGERPDRLLRPSGDNDQDRRRRWFRKR